MKFHRLSAVIRKETREIVRDRVTLAIAFLFPVLMLLIFGYAISLEVENVRLGVLDQDQTPASAELTDTFAASRYFELVRRFNSEWEMRESIQANEVKLVLLIPANFYREIDRKDAPQVQLLIDGTYSATALIALNYGLSIASRFQSERSGGGHIKVEPRVWYNPSLRSVIYVVSGLYAVIIASFPPLLTTLAIVREKESGAIQQIYASPLTVPEFLLGKLIPYGVISCIQLLSIVLVGSHWFGVPFNGNPWYMAIAGGVYVFCNVGIGLLISTITQSQLLAVLLALVVTMMPSMLFSGFVFPIYAMAEPVQLYTMLFPGRYFVELSRGITLKGASLGEMWQPLLALTAYTAAIFGAAVAVFKKKVA
ncbi:MAG: ABC transporter permease [Porticoccaceae bacterium]